MLISPRAVEAYQTRDLDNYLWMKRLTREQITHELRRLRVRPYFKTEPWLHQLVCFWIGICQPEFLYLLDMGLGKTKIILDLITQAQRERRLEQALVCVPRNINVASWADDIALHSDLEPTLIDCEDIDEKWERLSQSKGDVTVISYPSLMLALSMKKRKGKKTPRKVLKPDEDAVDEIKAKYNFIDFDEVHKLANDESLWWKLGRRLAGPADFTYANTGTLFGKDLEAIWPQFYLVDKGDTFGENKGLFRKTFFNEKANQWGRGSTFEYDKRMDRTLHRFLQHRSIRYDEDEVLDLPPLVSRVDHFEMTDEQREHYMRALEGLINAGGNVEELEGQWLQMRRIISGYMKWKDEHGDHVLRFKRNPKLEGLERFIDEVGHRSKIVISYEYTETGKMITELLDSMKYGYEWFYGGTKDHAASRRRFIADPHCEVFLMNSESGGTGTDGLQKVARYEYLYENPTPPTTRRQVIKRVHRPGQTQRSFVYDSVMRRSLDGGIIRDQLEHRDTYESVVKGKRRPGKGFFLTE